MSTTHTQSGWFARHRWLIARRCSQVAIMALFLAGPLFGVWWLKGNLTASLVLDTVPLTDPYVLVQSIAAGHWPALTAILGALIVAVGYAIVGGRVYCAWVCPINPVTDLAAWLRTKLGLEQKGWQPRRQTRLWLLGATVIVAALSGTIAWELINPVSMMHRGLIFGIGWAWTVVVAVFLFDLFVSRRGWCGRLCPVGAFYGLLGRASVVRVGAAGRAACDDCMDCYAVCPEPQVIAPALARRKIASALARGADTAAASPLILSSDCTKCGRCIDVCTKNVFGFGTRFDRRAAAPRGATAHMVNPGTRAAL